jgi:hypothetical protein
MQPAYELTQKDFTEAYSAHPNRSAPSKCSEFFPEGMDLTGFEPAPAISTGCCASDYTPGPTR